MVKFDDVVILDGAYFSMDMYRFPEDDEYYFCFGDDAIVLNQTEMMNVVCNEYDWYDILEMLDADGKLTINGREAILDAIHDEKHVMLMKNDHKNWDFVVYDLTDKEHWCIHEYADLCKLEQEYAERCAYDALNDYIELD